MAEQRPLSVRATQVMAPGSGPELVQKLLHQGIKRPELKDELYMQLLKQSRGNTTPSIIKVALSFPSLHTICCKHPCHRATVAQKECQSHAQEKDKRRVMLGRCIATIFTWPMPLRLGMQSKMYR